MKDFKDHHDLFEKVGEQYLHPKYWGESIWPVSVEDLYQAFKARMLEEQAASAPETRTECPFCLDGFVAEDGLHSLAGGVSARCISQNRGANT